MGPAYWHITGSGVARRLKQGEVHDLTKTYAVKVDGVNISVPFEEIDGAQEATESLFIETDNCMLEILVLNGRRIMKVVRLNDPDVPVGHGG